MGASIDTSFGNSRRTSGSPPVSRTSSTPISTKRRTSRSISSKARISARSSHGSPSAGMQYWQRKLQRSVTETRRSEIRRPWQSWSGSRTESGYIGAWVGLSQEPEYRVGRLYLRLAHDPQQEPLVGLEVVEDLVGAKQAPRVDVERLGDLEVEEQRGVG